MNYGNEDWLGDELPSRRADPQFVREKTGIRASGSLGLLKGSIAMIAPGERSPGAKAITFFALVMAAFIGVAAVILVCQLAHVAGLLLLIPALAVFAAVLFIGLIVVFHEKAPATASGSPAPADPGQRRTPPEQAPRQRGRGRAQHDP